MRLLYLELFPICVQLGIALSLIQGFKLNVRPFAIGGLGFLVLHAIGCLRIVDFLQALPIFGAVIDQMACYLLGAIFLLVGAFDAVRHHGIGQDFCKLLLLLLLHVSAAWELQQLYVALTFQHFGISRAGSHTLQTLDIVVKQPLLAEYLIYIHIIKFVVIDTTRRLN